MGDLFNVAFKGTVCIVKCEKNGWHYQGQGLQLVRSCVLLTLILWCQNTTQWAFSSAY